jgi:hypothetical protein
MALLFYILIGVCTAIFLYVVYTFFVKRADMYYTDGSFFGKLVKIGEESIFSTQHEGKVGDTSEKDEKAFIRQVTEGYANAPIKKGYVVKEGKIFNDADTQVAFCDPIGTPWFGLVGNILPAIFIILVAIGLIIFDESIGWNKCTEWPRIQCNQAILGFGIMLLIIALIKSYFTRKSIIYLTDNHGNTTDEKIGFVTELQFSNKEGISRLTKSAGCMALFEAFEASQAHKDVGRLPSFSAKDLAFPSMLVYLLLFSLLSNFILGIDRSNLQQEGFSYAAIMILIYGMIWYFMYILKTDMGNQNQTFYPLLQIINRNTGMRGWNLLLIFISALATILTITGLTKGNNVGGFVFFPLFFVILFATLYNFFKDPAAQWQMQEPVDRIINSAAQRLGRINAVIPQGQSERLEFNWDLSKTEIAGLSGTKKIVFEVDKNNFMSGGKVRKENPFYGKDSSGNDNWKKSWTWENGNETGIDHAKFKEMIKDVLQKNPESENEIIDKIVEACKSIMTECNLPFYEIFNLVTNFCQYQVDYKSDSECQELEGAKEYVRFAVESLKDKQGDCDCYSALAYKILKRLNLQPDDIKYAYSFDSNDTRKHAFLLLKKNGSIPFPNSIASSSVPQLGGNEYVFCECTIRPWKVGYNDRFAVDQIQIIDL